MVLQRRKIQTGKSFTSQQKNTLFLRPKETVRRELVIELFIQFIHKHKNERIPHLHVMMEVLAREATAKEDSRQTPEELKKLSHKGLNLANDQFKLF